MHIDRAKDTLKCYKCSGNHTISQCEAFKTLWVQERWELVKADQLSFSCLRKGHCTLKCHSKRRCSVNGCQRYHSQLLHSGVPASQALCQVSTSNVPAQPLLICLANYTNQQLFKMLPVNIYGPDGKREIIVMFDEGSSISIMEERLAKMIGAKGVLHPLTLQWYDNKVVTEKSYEINIEVRNCASNERFALRDVYTVNNLNLPEQSLSKEDFGHLRNPPLMNYHESKPGLLIGLTHAYLSATTTNVKADNESPLAAKTPLGWVAYGPTKSPSNSNPRVMLVKDCQQLHTLVSEYFASDSFGTNVSSVNLESEDEHARLILDTTTKRVGKHYETGLLWKTFPPKLPHSKIMAEKRLLSVER
ncbi:PREDICTED: uncharacterized protein LOC108369353 isoform X2 [Rhagoletis zephyria]|uniref:uncharacterized protein LOC108369353 isoform X1 n=1 Tax=Rhagoletis zephyria TaxID=28612 RepID=UPI00081142A0|nr:PREDICTED: uncharacterized protein LOC108369353 isoform X1 [Rhagoletis zephyria]XP_017479936.1 PREDICTED: uncharacterized protein LOC108369353 isoform X2 [Rhagoletis zephyria]